MLDLEHITKQLSSKLESYKREYNPFVTGEVLECNDDVIFASGLSSVCYGELLKIKSCYAMVLNLESEKVGAVVLNNAEEICAGDTVFATGHVLDVGVSDDILGRVVNPLGTPIDNLGEIVADKYQKLEADAPQIVHRAAVNEPLETGIISIDSMIPIGKGQRELIIGDRQTGKTAIAIDAILNQKGKDVICVYVAIGQKASSTTKILQTFRNFGALSYTTIVSASADQAASMQYLAPYTGCAIAEYFMHRGKDVLIVYDDLTKHAVAYRTLTLLLKRPSGREAYPGDIFYTHSRLLERAAKLNDAHGGGSMTALPIIETQMGDISAYIPTNVISITDGQIFLETELFRAGIRPAINVGLSVSRVGGAAQHSAMKKISGKLRLELANYRELVVFSQFTSDLDFETKKTLDHGLMLTQGLTQKQYQPQNYEKQIVFLHLLINNIFDDISPYKINATLQNFYEYLKDTHSSAIDNIMENKVLNLNTINIIKNAAEKFKAL
ncbi:MAG TPA: F0F1 ATP synthase subunit alpha [Clostridia bacterium]|nr:F0F1 ATP synthase subunit alpha [Clostridia bacterium]